MVSLFACGLSAARNSTPESIKADKGQIAGKPIQLGNDQLGLLLPAGINGLASSNGGLVVLAVKAAARSDEALQNNAAAMLSHWTAVLLDYLEADPEVTEQQVVELEWAYFQALRYSQRRARTLHRALARDPDFFVYLLKLIFCLPKTAGLSTPTSLTQ